MDYSISRRVNDEMLNSIINVERKETLDEYEHKISSIDYEHFNNLSLDSMKEMLCKKSNYCNFDNIIFYDVEAVVYTRDYVFISPQNKGFVNRSRVKTIAYIHNGRKIILLDESIMFEIKEDIEYKVSKHICYDFLKFIFGLGSVILIGFNSSSYNMDFKNNEKATEQFELATDYEWETFVDDVDDKDSNYVYSVGYDFPAVLRSYNYERDYFELDRLDFSTEYYTMKGCTSCYQCILKCNNVYMLDVLPYVSWSMARTFKHSEYMEYTGVYGNRLSSWSLYCVNMYKERVVDRFYSISVVDRDAVEYWRSMSDRDRVVRFTRLYNNDNSAINDKISKNELKDAIDLYIGWICIDVKFSKNWKGLVFEEKYKLACDCNDDEIREWVKCIDEVKNKISLRDTVRDINEALGSHRFGIPCRRSADQILMYNMMDVEVTEYIFRGFGEFTNVNLMMNTFDIPFRLALSSNSQISTFLFARRLYHSSVMHKKAFKVVWDNKNEIYDDFDFSGAIVNVPVSGLHFILAYIDFASLYPNVIIEFNICYTTYIGNSKDGIFEIYKGVPYRVVKDVGENLDVYYRTDMIGVLPQMMIDYFNVRNALKNILKENKSLVYLNDAVNSIKLGLNSTYGWIGYGKGNFYIKIIAGSVTAGSRQVKKVSENFIVNDMKLKVYYGDTDSNQVGFNCDELINVDDIKGSEDVKEDACEEYSSKDKKEVSIEECVAVKILKEFSMRRDMLELLKVYKYCSVTRNRNVTAMLRNVFVTLINTHMKDMGYSRCVFDCEEVGNMFYYPGPKKRYVFTDVGTVYEKEKIKGFQKSRYSRKANELMASFIKSFLDTDVTLFDKVYRYLKDIFESLPLVNEDIDITEFNSDRDKYIYFQTRVTSKNVRSLEVKSYKIGDEINYMNERGTVYTTRCVKKMMIDEKCRIYDGTAEYYGGDTISRVINGSVHTDRNELKSYLYSLPGVSGFYIGFDGNVMLGKLTRINIIRRVLYNMFSWFGFAMLNDKIQYEVGDDGQLVKKRKECVKVSKIQRRIIPIWNEFDYKKDDDIKRLAKEICVQLDSSIDFKEYNRMKNINIVQGKSCTLIRLDGYECTLIDDRQCQLKVYEMNKYYYGLSMLCGYQLKRKTILIGIDIDSPDLETVTLDLLNGDRYEMFGHGSQGKKGRHLFVELYTEDKDGVFTLPNVDKLYVDPCVKYVIELKGIPNMKNTNKVVELKLKTLQAMGRHRSDVDHVFKVIGNMISEPIRDVDFYNNLNMEDLLYVSEDEAMNRVMKKTYFKCVYGRQVGNKFLCSYDREKLMTFMVDDFKEYEDELISGTCIKSNSDGFVSGVYEVLKKFTYEDFWDDALQVARFMGMLRALSNKNEWAIISQCIETLPEFGKVEHKEVRMNNYIKDINVFGVLFQYNLMRGVLGMRYNEIKSLKSNEITTATKVLDEELKPEHFKCNHRLKIIRSGMGTGKTRELFKYLMQIDLVQSNICVIFLTCRNSQIVSLYEMCIKNNLTCQKVYKDSNYIDGKTIYLIQYESLIKYKINRLENIVLVIDEYLSLCSQIISSRNISIDKDAKEIHTEINIHHFFKLVNACQMCYVLDAYMDMGYIESLMQLFSNEKHEILVNNLKKIDPKVVYIKYENTFAHYLNYALDNYKVKMVICADTRIKLLSYYVLFLQSRLLKVGIIVGKKDYDELPNSFINRRNVELITYNDVNDTYDVIMYSNAITHTISFNESNFPATIVFAIFTFNQLAWQHKMQMLGRARLAKQIFVYNQEIKTPYYINKCVEEKKKVYYNGYKTKYSAAYVDEECLDFEKIDKFYNTISELNNQSSSIGLRKIHLEETYSEVIGDDTEFDIRLELVAKDYKVDKDSIPLIHQQVSRVGSYNHSEMDEKASVIEKVFSDMGKVLPRKRGDSIQLTETELLDVFRAYESYLVTRAVNMRVRYNVVETDMRKKSIINKLMKAMSYEVDRKTVGRDGHVWVYTCLFN